MINKLNQISKLIEELIELDKKQNSELFHYFNEMKFDTKYCLAKLQNLNEINL